MRNYVIPRVRRCEGEDMPKDIPQIALINRDINFFICYDILQGKRSSKRQKAKTYISHYSNNKNPGY